MSEYRFVYKHFRPRSGMIPYDAWSTSITFEESISFEKIFCKRAGGVLCHYRRGITPWEPASNGGLTKCYVYDSDNSLLATGTAECSVKDQFCYRVGRDIARGRALKNLQELEDSGK